MTILQTRTPKLCEKLCRHAACPGLNWGTAGLSRLPRGRSRTEHPQPALPCVFGMRLCGSANQKTLPAELARTDWPWHSRLPLNRDDRMISIILSKSHTTVRLWARLAPLTCGVPSSREWGKPCPPRTCRGSSCRGPQGRRPARPSPGAGFCSPAFRHAK